MRAGAVLIVLVGAVLSVGGVLARRADPPSTTVPPATSVLFPHPAASNDSSSTFNNVVFLHHSVGQNMIDQGQLRELLAARGYDLYDQGYNGETGLHRPDGAPAPYNYNVPSDNTDPDGLADIFAQAVDPTSLTSTGEPANTLSGLLRHEVIVFKSCFPNTFIDSDEKLAQQKAYYLNIRSSLDRYPDHIFIVVTSPPLEPGSTTPEAAARARSLAEWLTSPEYLDGHPNMYVFDLFSLLARPDQGRWDANTLRTEYRIERTGLRYAVGQAFFPFAEQIGVARRFNGLWVAGESHPNQTANVVIAPLLAEAIDAAAHTAGR